MVQWVNYRLQILKTDYNTRRSYTKVLLLRAYAPLVDLTILSRAFVVVHIRCDISVEYFLATGTNRPHVSELDTTPEIGVSVYGTESLIVDHSG